MNWSRLGMKAYGLMTELQRRTSKCMFGTCTPCMTSWRMGYSPAGVSTGSFHARYARQLYSLFGWRRVASSRRSTSLFFGGGLDEPFFHCAILQIKFQIFLISSFHNKTCVSKSYSIEPASCRAWIFSVFGWYIFSLFQLILSHRTLLNQSKSATTVSAEHAV